MINPITAAQELLQKWGYAQAQGQFGHTGSWGLPEFGVTEALAKEGYASQPLPQRTYYKPPTEPKTPTNQPVIKKVNLPNPTPTPNPNPNPNLVGQIYQQAGEEQKSLFDMQMEALNNEYNNLMSELSRQEQALPGRYETYKNVVSSGMAPILTSLEEAQTKKLGELQTQEAETKAQAGQNLKQIHQLLNDLQRKQAAALSATGNWTSTVAPALAEQFGRQAFGSVSELQSRRDRALADINRQINTVTDYYNQKKTDFETQKAAQLNKLEEDLQSNLNEISAQKTQAGTLKAQQAFSAWSDFLNNRRQIELAAAQWEQSLDMWKQQMDQQLQLAQQSLGAIQPQYLYQPLTFPNYSTEVPGVMTIGTGGQATWAPVTYNKKPGETDEEYLQRIYGTQPTTQKGIASWFSNLFK